MGQKLGQKVDQKSDRKFGQKSSQSLAIRALRNQMADPKIKKFVDKIYMQISVFQTL